VYGLGAVLVFVAVTLLSAIVPGMERRAQHHGPLPDRICQTSRQLTHPALHITVKSCAAGFTILLSSVG
jgi:hypothetical protein